jgi:aspartate aminotransferase
MITKKISQISPSATESMSALANKMKREGIDIISFAQGEPDFDTPENIKAAAVRAIQEGFTKYTDVPGILPLREAICAKLKRENGLDYEPADIVVSAGGKQALFEVFATLCEEGDKVMLPTPCYVSYVEQIKLAGASALLFPTKEENNFRVTFDEVRENYAPGVKAFVVNCPNNPTGCVYEEDELRKIAEFLVEKGVYLVSDDVYEHLIYDGRKFVTAASLSPRIKEKTIVVNALSKTYAMTGWRVGYAAGPREIMTAVNNYQGHVSGNINSIAQIAAIEALSGPQEAVSVMAAEFARRREYIVDRINSIDRMSCVKPDGAFYAFANVQGVYGASFGDTVIRNDLDVSRFFLEEAHVAVVPGVAFEYPGYVRFVFAKSMEAIKEGLDRVERAISRL